jgi:hypothetical protein
MSVTIIQQIVADAKVAFIAAKSDGKLEAEEVVQIALSVGKKVYAIAGASLQEKEALVLLCLKKGLAAAGGLQGLADLVGSGPEGLAAAEKQVLGAALKSVNILREHVPKMFGVSPAALLSCCSAVASVGSALLPKDAALIMEALQCVEAFAGKADVSGNAVVAAPAAPVAPAPVAPVAAVAAPVAPEVVETTQESVAATVAVSAPAPVPAAPSVADAPPQNISDAAPNPVASPPAAPESTLQVAFA